MSKEQALSFNLTNNHHPFHFFLATRNLDWTRWSSLVNLIESKSQLRVKTIYARLRKSGPYVEYTEKLCFGYCDEEKCFVVEESLISTRNFFKEDDCISLRVVYFDADNTATAVRAFTLPTQRVNDVVVVSAAARKFLGMNERVNQPYFLVIGRLFEYLRRKRLDHCGPGYNPDEPLHEMCRGSPGFCVTVPSDYLITRFFDAQVSLDSSSTNNNINNINNNINNNNNNEKHSDQPPQEQNAFADGPVMFSDELLEVLESMTDSEKMQLNMIFSSCGISNNNNKTIDYAIVAVMFLINASGRYCSETHEICFQSADEARKSKFGPLCEDWMLDYFQRGNTGCNVEIFYFLSGLIKHIFDKNNHKKISLKAIKKRHVKLSIEDLFGTIIDSKTIHLSVGHCTRTRITYHSDTGFSLADLLSLARRQLYHFDYCNMTWPDDSASPSSAPKQKELLLDNDDFKIFERNVWSCRNQGFFQSFTHNEDNNHVDLITTFK